MGDYVRDDMVTDFDLNQEPLDPPVGSVLGLGSLLNELETAHGRIEERIRQLGAVTARARQRQRWRQARNPPETSDIPIEPMVNTGGQIEVHNGEDSVGALERTLERGKSCKRDSSHLVAKALEMDLDAKRVSMDGGSFFDCNICLDIASEPILTCCGHLFCWACFYQLPYVDSTAKECPVCKGEVTDTNLTPIYGDGNNTHVPLLESGLKIPPRPQAHRVESVRQQRVNRGVSHIPVAEALRRIRTGIGATGEHSRQLYLDSVIINSNTTSQGLPNAEAGGSRRLSSHQYSGVSLESASASAASLSSISSALNNAERIVEDLETYINDRLVGRSHSQFLPVDVGVPSTSNAAVIQSEHQNVDSTAGINSTVSLALSFAGTAVSAAAVRLENLSTGTATETNLARPHTSSSSRRRSGPSRVSEVDNGVPRESRRRRLR